MKGERQALEGRRCEERQRPDGCLPLPPARRFFPHSLAVVVPLQEQVHRRAASVHEQRLHVLAQQRSHSLVAALVDGVKVGGGAVPAAHTHREK